MNPAALRTLRNVGIVVGALLVSTLLRIATNWMLPTGVGFPYYLLVIVFCSRYCDRWAAWLALLLAAIPATYFRCLEDGEFLSSSAPAATIIFLITGTIMVLVVHAERQARELAEATAGELRTQQDLLKRLYESQENERRLVSFELHDGPIQYATAAVLHLEAYRNASPPRPEELELTSHFLKKTLKESRRLMNGLRPPVLDEAGLVPAIEQVIVEDASERPRVEFVHEGELGRFAPSLESAIYRIAQEGLTNARKHSRSDKVRISFGRLNGHLRLEIQDWGVGFEPSEVAGHRGGLKGFAERVRLAGGRLKIDSSPGKGTLIVVEMPVLHAI